MSTHKLSIVMPVYNRPRLAKQAIESLLENTSNSFHLLIVNDCSSNETRTLLSDYSGLNCRVVHSSFVHLGPGKARNIGIQKMSDWGRGEWLYTCDSDSWHSKGWDEVLLAQWEGVRRRFKGPLALGGYAHPFQQRGAFLGAAKARNGHSVRELEALGLLSWLIQWESWDQHGPLDPSPKINGSEDWALSQKIRQAGGKVGVVEPAIVLNCGATSSDGRPCPGSELLWQQNIPEGVLIG